MRAICGLLGSLIGLVAVAITPAPNLQLTSYIKSHDIWTEQVNFAWKGWVYLAAIVLGFFVGNIIYFMQNPHTDE